MWQTARFDLIGTNEPRLFATPLYVHQVAISAGPQAGKTLSVIYAASDLGYVYAINATAMAGVPAGTILWSKRFTQNRPGGMGALSTPVIDLKRQRLYTVCADGHKQPHQAYALDLRSGEAHPGWPFAISAAAVNAPGVNRNGAAQFPEGPLIQRGALNLSPEATRLYVSFAKGGRSPGWIVALDTERAAVATAFSATASKTEIQGGMWASGGPTVDPEGFIHIATGSSVQVMIKKLGLPGIFFESEGNWGQSILRLGDDREAGFSLAGTYSPFNYAQAQVMDIDLGSSGATAIDLDPATTATPKLLVFAGKQGNVYLLDRAQIPGSLVKRPPPSGDSRTDGSLLSPQPQPQFGQRGPLILFGPYADTNAANNQARSRTMGRARPTNSRPPENTTSPPSYTALSSSARIASRPSACCRAPRPPARCSRTCSLRPPKRLFPSPPPIPGSCRPAGPSSINAARPATTPARRASPPATRSARWTSPASPIPCASA